MPTDTPLILGLNGPFHELSACVLHGSQVLAFAEEERFTRIKRAKYPTPTNPDQLPEQAIAWCLKQAGVTGADLDLIGYPYDPEVPVLLPGDLVVEGGWGSRSGEAAFQARLRQVPRLLSGLLGGDVTDRFRWIRHHLTHAASAYFASPYDDAAVLSIDGRGERDTTVLLHGQGTRLTVLSELHYPHSLGFLWEALSQFTGLDQFAGPGQLMGLAAWGDPHRFERALDKLLTPTGDGFRVDNSYTQFRLLEQGGPADRLEELFGPRRPRGEPQDGRDADLAAALQAHTERVLLELADHLQAATGSANLTMAGGVALNCVAAGRINRESGYHGMFIQPAAGDAGCALGAALWLAHTEAGVTDRWTMPHAYLGPEYSERDILESMHQAGLAYTRPDDLTNHVARLLTTGQLIGWFQGPSEIGPRALGNRSILADPRNPLAPTRINFTKHRAGWRPMTPSILAEEAWDWIRVGAASPSHQTMNYTYPVHPMRQQQIPAVVHADGHARAQLVTPDANPRYHELLRRYYRRTGVPMLLNTSFNGPHEPIVLTPGDAIRTWQGSNLHALALGDYLITRDHGGVL